MFRKILIGVLSMLLAIAVIAAATFLYEYFERSYWEGQQNLVKMDIAYNIVDCSHKAPLEVTAKNNSENVVDSIWWHTGVYKQGHSQQLALKNSLFDEGSSYDYDKILQPGESWKHCTSLPELKSPIQVESIEASIKAHQSFTYTIGGKIVFLRGWLDETATSYPNM